MKKIFVLLATVSLALVFTGIHKVYASTTYINGIEMGVDNYEYDAQVEFLDTDYYSNSSYTIIGDLYSSSDTDYYTVVLNDFVKLTVTFTDGLNYKVLMQSGKYNNIITTTQSQLEQGVYLSPGSYSFKVYTDSTAYSNSYYLHFSLDSEAYFDNYIDSRNVYDEVVNDTKVLTWVNSYDPQDDNCWSLTYSDCIVNEYIGERLYFLDRDYVYYLQASFLAISHEVLKHYNEYDNLATINDVVSTAVENIGGEIEPWVGFAAKGEQLLFDSIQDPILKASLNNYLDSEYQDYGSDGYISFLESFHDNSLLVDLIEQVNDSNNYEDTMNMIQDVAEGLSYTAALLDVDDYIYIDLMKSCNNNPGHPTCSYSGVEYDAGHIVRGSDTDNDNAYQNDFTSGSINIWNYVYDGEDYGTFLSPYVDTSKNEYKGLLPVVHPMFDEQLNIDNYNNFLSDIYQGNTISDDTLERLIYIEKDDPNALNILKKGVTAYEVGEGFLAVSLDSYDGFSTLGPKSATFSATSLIDPSKSSSITLYYLVYSDNGPTYIDVQAPAVTTSNITDTSVQVSYVNTNTYAVDLYTKLGSSNYSYVTTIPANSQYSATLTLPFGSTTALYSKFIHESGFESNYTYKSITTSGRPTITTISVGNTYVKYKYTNNSSQPVEVYAEVGDSTPDIYRATLAPGESYIVTFSNLHANTMYTFYVRFRTLSGEYSATSSRTVRTTGGGIIIAL